MPRYIYDVLDENGEKTGEQVEKWQKISEDPLTEDEDGRKLSRSINGGSGVHYKGGGWPTKEFKRG